MDNDNNKESPDGDDSSASSNKSKKQKAILVPPILLQHGRQKSMFLLQQMAPKEQEEMTQDMYSQMKQLKEHNEAMGYHGYSGYLHRHDSNQHNEQISTDHEFETDADYEVSNLKFVNLRSHPKISKHNKGNNSIILSETAPLKQKLENISSSINRIRHDLNQQNKGQISEKELNEMIVYFQNQLTHIQDQIEDAENDVESNIDVCVLKYQEDIKVNKQKIKSMKKEKKEKEKQQQIQKQKEQQNIIELQRLKIEQLTMQKSHSPPLRSQVAIGSCSPEPVVHTSNHAHIGRTRAQTLSCLPKKSPPFKSRRSMQSYNTFLPQINQSEEDSYGDERFQEDAEEISSQYMNIMNPGPGISFQQTQYSEGGFQMQRQQPLLSDTAVKIIGGAAIVLAGLWIISKYIDSKRRPPSRYMR